MLLLLFLGCVLGQCMAGAGEAVTATNLDDTNFNNLVSKRGIKAVEIFDNTVT